MKKTVAFFNSLTWAAKENVVDWVMTDSCESTVFMVDWNLVKVSLSVSKQKTSMSAANSRAKDRPSGPRPMTAAVMRFDKRPSNNESDGNSLRWLELTSSLVFRKSSWEEWFVVMVLRLNGHSSGTIS